MSSDELSREDATVQAVKHRVKSWTSTTALRRPKEMFTVGDSIVIARSRIATDLRQRMRSDRFEYEPLPTPSSIRGILLDASVGGATLNP